MKCLKLSRLSPMAAMLMLICFLPLRSVAMPIDPGFDLFSTPDGGAFLDLGPYLPGGGIVDLTGDPIGPGNTDTIVERLTELPDGGTGTIDIELVALSLRSVAPVDISSTLFDMAVTLDTTTPSLGQMTIISHGSGGGSFDSFFDVFVEVILTEVGNPSNIFSFLAHELITATGTTWSHTPPPDYPDDPAFPSGGFYSGPIEHTGPHPLIIPSVIPLPAALPLFAAALALMGYGGWRRRFPYGGISSIKSN